MKKNILTRLFLITKNKFDSNLKNFPTTIGSPNFKPLIIDKSSTYNARNYFNSKFDELKKE